MNKVEGVEEFEVSPEYMKAMAKQVINEVLQAKATDIMDLWLAENNDKVPEGKDLEKYNESVSGLKKALTTYDEAIAVAAEEGGLPEKDIPVLTPDIQVNVVKQRMQAISNQIGEMRIRSRVMSTLGRPTEPVEERTEILIRESDKLKEYHKVVSLQLAKSK